MTKSKKNLKEGDVMRVKATGTLVRLIMPENPNEEQVLINGDGHVYVEPETEVDDWYHISDLERP